MTSISSFSVEHLPTPGAGTDLFVGKFTMGDLSHAELMRSIDLFASHVMKR